MRTAARDASWNGEPFSGCFCGENGRRDAIANSPRWSSLVDPRSSDFAPPCCTAASVAWLCVCVRAHVRACVCARACVCGLRHL